MVAASLVSNILPFTIPKGKENNIDFVEVASKNKKKQNLVLKHTQSPGFLQKSSQHTFSKAQSLNSKKLTFTDHDQCAQGVSWKGRSQERDIFPPNSSETPCLHFNMFCSVILPLNSLDFLHSLLFCDS